MKDFDKAISNWAKAQHDESSAYPAFTAAVMERVRTSASPEPQRSSPKQTVPNPFFAALCLLAGFGKLALVLHLAF